MVATVTGIAPFVSMVRNYSQRRLSSQTFYILHGASNKDELAYKDELERLSREHKNIIYIPTVSRPEEERNKGWEGEKGRVNSIVEKYLEKFSLDPKSTLVYACGHPGMIEEVKQVAVSRGYKFKEEKYWRE
jgi:NAD(P)H-flavin reductase